MHRILFICHGNICRSTMAQFVFEELVRRAGLEGEFTIDSAATSREEIGNPPHHGTVAKLREVGIPVGAHRARQITRGEYGNWDLIAYMVARTNGASIAFSTATPTSPATSSWNLPEATATWPIPGIPGTST